MSVTRDDQREEFVRGEAPEPADRELSHRGKPRGTNSMELIFLIGFVGLWIALQMWVLPKFGVST